MQCCVYGSTQLDFWKGAERSGLRDIGRVCREGGPSRAGQVRNDVLVHCIAVVKRQTAEYVFCHQKKDDFFSSASSSLLNYAFDGHTCDPH